MFDNKGSIDGLNLLRQLSNVVNTPYVDNGEENKGTEDDCELSEPHRESQLSDPSPSSETVLHSSIMLIIF